MLENKMPHFVDSILTQEAAGAALENGPVTVGLYTNIENVQSVVHSHPYYEMILPVSGSIVRYSIGGSIFDLQLGELIFFPAGMYHSGLFHVTDTVSDRLVVQIQATLWNRISLMTGLSKNSWQQNLVILDAEAVRHWDLRGLLERLGHSCRLDSSIRAAVQDCEISELLLLLDHQLMHQETAAPGAYNELVTRAVAYLQSHYTDTDLTVSRLAGYTYTSREHLSRVFREYTLESVHSYLTNLRMQHCRDALAMGSSVLDACNDSGFSNYSSFLKSFRSLYGVTPTEYRARIRQGKDSP